MRQYRCTHHECGVVNGENGRKVFYLFGGEAACLRHMMEITSSLLERYADDDLFVSLVAAALADAEVRRGRMVDERHRSAARDDFDHVMAERAALVERLT